MDRSQVNWCLRSGECGKDGRLATGKPSRSGTKVNIKVWVVGRNGNTSRMNGRWAVKESGLYQQREVNAKHEKQGRSTRKERTKARLRVNDE